MAVLISALSIILLLISSFLGSANATPSVRWSQPAVDAAIPRGSHKEIAVSLDALETIGSVDLKVVPELSPYVDVVPSAVQNLVAGDVVPIQISVHADPNAPLRSVDGVIQVRAQVTRRGNGRVFSRPLPVRILIQEEEGVVGTDSDGNGVWDYIDQYINTKYPGTENQEMRTAARQYARSIQGGLLNADDKQMALQFSSASDRATECIFYLNPENAADVLRDLESAILNTETRTKAFFMFSEQSVGEVFASTPFSKRSDSCITE